jgi:hypothetical protein
MVMIMKMCTKMYFWSLIIVLFASLSILSMQPQEKANIPETIQEEQENIPGMTLEEQEEADTHLHNAVKENSLDGIINALDEGADVNMQIEGISLMEWLVLYINPNLDKIPRLIHLIHFLIRHQQLDINANPSLSKGGPSLLDRLANDPEYRHFIYKRAVYIQPLLYWVEQNGEEKYIELRQRVDVQAQMQKIHDIRRAQKGGLVYVPYSGYKYTEAANARLTDAVRTNFIPDVIQAIKGGGDPNLMIEGILVLERLVLINLGDIERLKNAITLLLKKGADANPTRDTGDCGLLDRLENDSTYRHYITERAPLIAHLLDWAEARGLRYPRLRMLLPREAVPMASWQSILRSRSL